MIKVKNKDPKLNSNEHYWYHKDDNGIEYLFSDYQLQQATFRATQNMEDLISAPEERKNALFFLLGVVSSAILFTMVYFGTVLFINK